MIMDSISPFSIMSTISLVVTVVGAVDGIKLPPKNKGPIMVTMIRATIMNTNKPKSGLLLFFILFFSTPLTPFYHCRVYRIYPLASIHKLPYREYL